MAHVLAGNVVGADLDHEHRHASGFWFFDCRWTRPTAPMREAAKAIVLRLVLPPCAGRQFISGLLTPSAAGQTPLDRRSRPWIHRRFGRLRQRPPRNPLSRPAARCAASRPAVDAAAPSLQPRARQPGLPLGRLGQDHRHRLGMDCADLGVGLRRQEPEEIGAPALLHLPHRGPGRPDAGEEGERPALVEGEPDRRPRAVGQRLVLGEAGERHQAAVLVPSHPRQCEEVVCRMLVTPGSPSCRRVCGGVGMPQRAIASSRPSGVADDRGAVVRDRCRAAAACCRRGRSARRRAGESPPETSASSTRLHTGSLHSAPRPNGRYGD